MKKHKSTVTDQEISVMLRRAAESFDKVLDSGCVPREHAPTQYGCLFAIYETVVSMMELIRAENSVEESDDSGEVIH